VAENAEGGLSPEQHRQLAADLFNLTWSLIQKADRTPAEADTMLHAAHASRYHWGAAAGTTPSNLSRGEWQCSRVYAVLGRAEPAIWHGRRSLAICEEHEIGDWDLAFAFEALARAYRVAGDEETSSRWMTLARTAGEHIAEPEDRELLFSDLGTI
jgi:hypothetical protein